MVIMYKLYKQTVRCLIFLSVYFCFVKSIAAVATTITELPQTISSEPFSLKITVSGAGEGNNYLRLDIYKLGSTEYFGETFNGLAWYSDNDFNQYNSVNIESGSDWSGELLGKVGMPNLTQYAGPGIYMLRIRRYTSSGNYNPTEANNSAMQVNIDVQLLTPTTAPNPTPSETSAAPEKEEQSITPTISNQPQTYSNVYLSEIMVDPENGSNEWIEFFNANDFTVFLDGWKIDDLENSGSAPRLFSLTIPAKNYGSLDLSGSIFNNTGDSVRLLDFNQKEIDSFQFESSEKGIALARTSFDSDSFCLQKPTKNQPNTSCLKPTNVSSPKSTITPTPTEFLSKTPTALLSTSQVRPSTKPVNFSFIGQNLSYPTEFPEELDNNVLGESTKVESEYFSNYRALISSLTFASFFYSLSALVSILIKLKIKS